MGRVDRLGEKVGDVVDIGEERENPGKGEKVVYRDAVNRKSEECEEE